MKTKTWLYRLLGVLIVLVMAQSAHAQGGFSNSGLKAVYSICPITNNTVIASQNSVGYYTDQSSLPSTGDVVYIRATSANVSPCLNDTVGFDFFLPMGAEYAISAQAPVRCYAVNISNGQAEEFTNNPSGYPGSCSQTGYAGSAGGVSFGYSQLGRGFQLDIRVPVRFNRQLLGLAGPGDTSTAGPNTHNLGAVASTAWGNATSIQPVTVFYRAGFENTSASDVTGSSATLNTNLFSYFKGGSLIVDFGAGNFGTSTSPTTVPDSGLNFPNVNAPLSGLNPNTTYQARFRFVTASGSFTSPTQTFITSNAPVSNFVLNVTKAGNGSGSVASNPAGIQCGTTCSVSFVQGSSVTLTPSAASGSSFAGWSGACSGTGNCTISMNAAQNVTATFNTTAQSFGSLTLEVVGLPAGNSADLSISGPNGLRETRTIGTGTGSTYSDVVTGAYTVSAPSKIIAGKTYNPNPASQTVTVNATGNATARVTYTSVPAGTTAYALSLSKGGNGQGTVSSLPVGLNCGSTCTANFGAGFSVVLTPTAASGSGFSGWSGACSGTGACALTMDAAKNVTANFALAAIQNLTASKPSNAPNDASINKGASNVPMLAFALEVSQATQLENIRLQASGSGDDGRDLVAIKLVRDGNANGKVDAGEDPIATGTFSGNDGTLTLSPAAALPLVAGTQAFVVVADFNALLAFKATVVKAASAPIPLLLLSLLFLGCRSSRARLASLILLMGISLVSCNNNQGIDNPPATGKTYQISLAAVQAQGLDVTGLPIQGATITVQK
jgi:Divergent InlB B-repeat domain